MRSFFQKLQDFLWKPASARPIGALRIGVALVLLVQGFWIAGDIRELYSRTGILHSQLRNSIVGHGSLGAAQLARWAQPWGIGEARIVDGVFNLYLGGLFFLLLGWHTRLAAWASFWSQFVLLCSLPAASGGAAPFAHIVLFYFLFAPIDRFFSLDRLMSQTTCDRLDAWNRLALRAIQCHLCIAYLVTGLEKITGAQWWNGEAIWRAMMVPDFTQFYMHWLAYMPYLAVFSGWYTLVVEVGYAFFIWPRGTRTLWIGATLVLHAAAGIFLGLYAFSALMMVVTFCTFGVAPEPEAHRSFTIRARRFFSLARRELFPARV